MVVYAPVLLWRTALNILWLKDSIPLLHSEVTERSNSATVSANSRLLSHPRRVRYHAGHHLLGAFSEPAQASYTAVYDRQGRKPMEF